MPASVRGLAAALGLVTDETIGLNWKPEVPKTFDGMVVRPEARWDHSSDTKPCNDGTEHNQFTFGADVIVPFASQ